MGHVGTYTAGSTGYTNYDTDSLWWKGVIQNDKCSGISVPKGLIAVVYKMNYWTGEYVTFYGPTQVSFNSNDYTHLNDRCESM